MELEERAVRVYAGIDWATEEHQVCALGPSGRRLGERVVKHDAAGLQGLCDWLLSLAGGDPQAVWIGIEVPRGAVVETLLEKGFVVFAINPKQMDRFRDRFTVAGAKDDRLDALVIGDSLRTDTHLYRRLKIDEPAVIELREWSRMGAELTDEHARLTNRLRHQLQRYYPQILELTSDIGKDWFLDLWELVPTPAKARRARPQKLARLLRARRVRTLEATAVLETLRKPALVVAPGTTEAATAHVKLLGARLRLVNSQLKECGRQIDTILDVLNQTDEESDGEPGERGGHRDVEILRSLPGVGRIVLAALLAEAGQALAERDYHALRSLSGIAPVTRNSGKRKGKRSVVVMRRACNARLREAMYHWSRVAIQKDPVSRLRYTELRRRGHRHGRALRTVADRLLAVACAMLRDGTLFDHERRVAVAKKQVA